MPQHRQAADGAEHFSEDGLSVSAFRKWRDQHHLVLVLSNYHLKVGSHYVKPYPWLHTSTSSSDELLQSVLGRRYRCQRKPSTLALLPPRAHRHLTVARLSSPAYSDEAC